MDIHRTKLRHAIGRLARSRGRKGSAGQALVELALVTPIMLILLLAAIDLGRIYYAQITVANAARSGAYEYSTSVAATGRTPTYVAGTGCPTPPTANSVMCAVLHEANGSAVNIAPADVSMTCTPACSPTYGNKVGVTVVGHFQVLTPLMWVFTGGSNVDFASTAVADVIRVPGPAGSTAPSASFDATPLTGDAPLAVTVTDTSTGGPTAWAWNFGDGTPTVIGRVQPAHTYALSGTYTIRLTASNTGGSSDAYRDITVTAPVVVAPVAAFDATPMTGNAPLVVAVSDSSGGTPTSWAWTFGDGGTSNVQNPPPHTYASAGTYQLRLTVTNSAGSNFLQKDIVVGSACPLPVAGFSYSQQNKNRPVVFTSTSTPTSPPACAISFWRWQYGDPGNNTDAGNFPTSSFDYNNPGNTYNVTLTVTSPAGITSTTQSVTTRP